MSYLLRLYRDNDRWFSSPCLFATAQFGRRWCDIFDRHRMLQSTSIHELDLPRMPAGTTVWLHSAPFRSAVRMRTAERPVPSDFIKQALRAKLLPRVKGGDDGQRNSLRLRG